MILIVRSFLGLIVHCFVSLLCLDVAAPQDTDSDVDIYGQRYPPSAESLAPPGGGRMANSDSSTPTFVDYGGSAGAREAYPAWNSERQIPLSKEEIEDIFLDLTQKFGFQRDSMRNMVSSLQLYHQVATGTVPRMVAFQLSHVLGAPRPELFG